MPARFDVRTETKGAVLLDSLSRPLRDLRLSVTDRCNLRCTYCMPREIFGPDHQFLPKELILNYEEMTVLVKAISGLGLHKLRLTGGEPLLRKDLHRLIEMLRIELGEEIDIAMTTNGILLAKHADKLAKAGLNRVTVSLDSLDDEIFRIMSDTKTEVAHVLNGIKAAKNAGLGVKVNCVIRKGTNENQILPLVDHFRNTGVCLRFIEYMDVGNSNEWSLEEVFPASEMIDMIDREFPIKPVAARQVGQVAKTWEYLDGAGSLGFITSVSQPFCGDCCRARLSVDGHLYTCLFASKGTDLMSPLRQGLSEKELAELASDIWRKRDDRYSELRGKLGKELEKVEMSYIGG